MGLTAFCNCNDSSFTSIILLRGMSVWIHFHFVKYVGWKRFGSIFCLEIGIWPENILIISKEAVLIFSVRNQKNNLNHIYNINDNLYSALSKSSKVLYNQTRRRYNLTFNNTTRNKCVKTSDQTRAAKKGDVSQQGFKNLRGIPAGFDAQTKASAPLKKG